MLEVVQNGKILDIATYDYKAQQRFSILFLKKLLLIITFDNKKIFFTIFQPIATAVYYIFTCNNCNLTY